MIFSTLYSQGLRFSSLIFNKLSNGSVTNKEHDPVIANTTKIIINWKFDFIPHLDLNFLK